VAQLSTTAVATSVAAYGKHQDSTSTTNRCFAAGRNSGRTGASAQDRLLAASRALLEELSGYDLSQVDPATSLLELGLDSLFVDAGRTSFSTENSAYP